MMRMMDKNDLLNQYIAKNVLRQKSFWNGTGEDIFDKIVKIIEYENQIVFVHCNTYSKDCYLMEYFGDLHLVFDEWLLWVINAGYGVGEL